MRENQIYTTTNYDQFVFRQANRDVDLSHVNRIAESMEKNGWQGAPIEVSLIPEKNQYQTHGNHVVTVMVPDPCVDDCCHHKRDQKLQCRLQHLEQWRQYRFLSILFQINKQRFHTLPFFDTPFAALFFCCPLIVPPYDLYEYY